MEPVEAVKSVISKYFTVSGRASRSEYWWFVAFCVFVSFVAGFVEGVVGLSYFSMAITLITFIPSVTVAIRRLHDKDRSGWWLFIMFVPLIGVLILVYWFATRGTSGDNRYGPDPVSEI